MTIFSLPRTLVAGTPENVNHVQENFVALRDQINGNLDAANLAFSASPSNLMGAYRTVTEVVSTFDDNAVTAAGIYIPSQFGRLVANGATTAAGGTATRFVHFDPVRYSVAGLTPKLRTFAAITTNSVNPAINFTFSLRSITATTGASDNMGITVNAAAHVTGSDCTVTPGAGSIGTFNASSDFDVPIAGTYALNLTTSTGVVSGAMGFFWVGLMIRWA